jgi:SAM-dependent methyltransferase
MNLVDMARRNDPNLVLDSSVKAAKRKVDDFFYRGFDLIPSESPAICVKNVFNWYPFCERPEIVGWFVKALDSKSEGQNLQVSLQAEDGSVVAESQIRLGNELKPVFVPAPSLGKSTSQMGNLTIKLPKSARGSVFLTVNRVLERAELIALGRGRGVEIGPGTNPQVLPSDRVDVTYIEQSSPEQWHQLYNDTGKYPVDPELWSRYQIGEAHSLPVEDESLNFIFSSHVFEHLANPIAYLQYWHRKLKSGGMVLAIVPDVAGCKDYVYRPCPVGDFLQEYEAKIMEPTIEHYARWAKYRAPGRDPQTFYEAKRSIHVHFYTNRNMAELLEYAVRHLGYAWFDIRHTPNHKDFYFVLSKA